VGTRGVVAGRVVKVRPHPYGEHIWLADVNIGDDYLPQIIWGGVPIVKDGCLVPVAQPGAWLPATKDKPSPYKIRPRNYRGVRSEGMLCSLAELGWNASVTDRVALLNPAAHLRAGDSLDDRYVDWQLIVMSEINLPQAASLTGAESAKVLQKA
jgi:tRNA-binding EMAP/Myf-like protein